MAVSRISCPECEAVLKPAQPVPVGKKVKCPRCGNLFTVTGEAPRPAAPKKAGARPGAAPAKKKPAPAQPAPKKPADEDEEGGTYAVVRDPDLDVDEEEEGEEEGRKPKINYAPDMSIKDLRGPAMELIVRPSNFLIFQGILGFIGWLALLVVILIPILFPLENAEDKEKEKNQFPVAAQKKDEKKEPESKHSFFEIFGWKFANLNEQEWWQPALLIGGCVLAMVYAGFLTFGAIKIQNLESRRWGIASSIMAFLPITTAGFGLFVYLFLQILFRMLFDEEDTVMIISGVWLGILWLVCLGIGVWNLRTLLQEQVIEGFEYRAD